MAMNLGGEIDDLVEEGQPGYFLWGDSIIEDVLEIHESA